MWVNIPYMDPMGVMHTYIYSLPTFGVVLELKVNINTIHGSFGNYVNPKAAIKTNVRVTLSHQNEMLPDSLLSEVLLQVVVSVLSTPHGALQPFLHPSS